MSRKKIIRTIDVPPKFIKFGVFDNENNAKEFEYLNIDEYEAIRLVDYENLNHNNASKIMNISRPTLTRILNSARRKIAEFLINGTNLIIINNDAKFLKNWYGCCDCKYFWIVKYNEKQEFCPKCNSKNIKNGLDCLNKLSNIKF